MADPYEGRWCQVLGSHLEQGGEGLFAKREVATVGCMMSDCQVEEGDLLAFYGGVQVQHTNYASDYKIRLSDDTDIDIPQVDKHNNSRAPLSSIFVCFFTTAVYCIYPSEFGEIAW